MGFADGSRLAGGCLLVGAHAPHTPAGGALLLKTAQRSRGSSRLWSGAWKQEAGGFGGNPTGQQLKDVLKAHLKPWRASARPPAPTGRDALGETGRQAGKSRASSIGTPERWEGQRAEPLTSDVAVYRHLRPQARSLAPSVTAHGPRSSHWSSAREGNVTPADTEETSR